MNKDVSKKEEKPYIKPQCYWCGTPNNLEKNEGFDNYSCKDCKKGE